MAIEKQKLVEKRTFKEGSSLAKIQDRITELELRIKELEEK